MAEEPEHLQSCDACGATVYPEHIDSNRAGRVEGKLLCIHCMAEKRASADDVVDAEVVDDSISLVDEDDEGAGGRRTQIRSFGGGPGGMSDSIAGEMASHERDFQRPLLKGQPSATRCRTFHSKLNDASMVYMNDQINAWVDAHEDIEIKFATSTIGVVEGKHADPHLIVTVFY